jgi:hypothetical protein
VSNDNDNDNGVVSSLDGVEWHARSTVVELSERTLSCQLRITYLDSFLRVSSFLYYYFYYFYLQVNGMKDVGTDRVARPLPTEMPTMVNIRSISVMEREPTTGVMVVFMTVALSPIVVRDMVSIRGPMVPDTKDISETVNTMDKEPIG